MSEHTDIPATTPDDPFDASLSELFASARPDAGFEDRIIRSLRAGDPMPRRKFRWRSHPLTWGVAASIGLGAIGAGVSSFAGDSGLPLPWGADEFAKAEFDLRSDRSQSTTLYESLLGLTSDSEAAYMADDSRSMDFARGHGASRARFGYSTIPDGEAKGEEKALKEIEDLSKKLDGLPARPDTNGTSAWEDFRGYYANPRWDKNPARPSTNRPSGGDGYLNYFNDYGTTWAAKPQDSGVAAFNPDAYRFVLPSGQPEKDVTLGVAVVDAPTAGKNQSDAVRLKESESKPPTGDTVLFARNGVVADPVRATDRYSPIVNFSVQPADPNPPVTANPVRKVILRSGEVEFEVESFDSAVAAVTKLVVSIDGAFVATVNSEKLPNGKVKGSVTLRVPPDKLDGLVLDLRKELGQNGELKGQRIGSQDVTKQYTDLESRLKAARTMETRLLAIIRDGKGEIKELLEAEKELGVWRTKIEEFEGEKRYFDNLAALSTLTVTLAEKEIKAAAGVTESEVVQTGVEVEDVEQAFRDALAAVAAANGRVTKSELKQVSSGQFNATLNFEVAPDAAGPIRDRLRQLGRVARLEITRVVTANNGGETVTKDAKLTRGDTQFQVQLYNVANMPPRETVSLGVASPDVPVGFRAVREAVEKAKGRILSATLNESDQTNVTAQLDFEVKRADEAAVLTAVGAAGEVVSREVTRAAESDAVTDTKVRFQIRIVNAHRLPPRESISLTVEAGDVDASGAILTTAVKDAGGRVADAGTSTDRETGIVTARYVFDVPLAAAAGIAEKAKATGAVKSNQVTRNPSAPDGRYATARIEVILATPSRIVAPNEGFAPQLKSGLSFSAKALFASLSWLVFGLLVVLPWAVVVYGGYRLIRRLTRSSTAPTTPKTS